MDARIQALPFEPAQPARPVARADRSHHQNNYGGAVKRLNAIRAQLAPLRSATAPGFVLNGLKREELIATNSMLLHELYFASLGGDGVTMEPADAARARGQLRQRRTLARRVRRHGQGARRRLGLGAADASSRAKARSSTSGPPTTRHAIAGGVPILALDMYEHAYHMDYGAAAGRVRRRVHGATSTGRGVYARYQAAVHAASEPFGGQAEDVVRRTAAGRAPRRRLRAGGDDDSRRALARPGRASAVGGRAAGRPPRRRLLRLRPRGRPRHRMRLRRRLDARY